MVVVWINFICFPIFPWCQIQSAAHHHHHHRRNKKQYNAVKSSQSIHPHAIIIHSNRNNGESCLWFNTSYQLIKAIKCRLWRKSKQTKWRRNKKLKWQRKRRTVAKPHQARPRIMLPLSKHSRIYFSSPVLIFCCWKRCSLVHKRRQIWRTRITDMLTSFDTLSAKMINRKFNPQFYNTTQCEACECTFAGRQRLFAGTLQM